MDASQHFGAPHTVQGVTLESTTADLENCVLELYAQTGISPPTEEDVCSHTPVIQEEGGSALLHAAGTAKTSRLESVPCVAHFEQAPAPLPLLLTPEQIMASISQWALHDDEDEDRAPGTPTSIETLEDNPRRYSRCMDRLMRIQIMFTSTWIECWQAMQQERALLWQRKILLRERERGERRALRELQMRRYAYTRGHASNSDGGGDGNTSPQRYGYDRNYEAEEYESSEEEEEEEDYEEEEYDEEDDYEEAYDDEEDEHERSEQESEEEIEEEGEEESYSEEETPHTPARHMDNNTSSDGNYIDSDENEGYSVGASVLAVEDGLRSPPMSVVDLNQSSPDSVNDGTVRVLLPAFASERMAMLERVATSHRRAYEDVQDESPLCLPALLVPAVDIQDAYADAYTHENECNAHTGSAHLVLSVWAGREAHDASTVNEPLTPNGALDAAFFDMCSL